MRAMGDATGVGDHLDADADATFLAPGDAPAGLIAHARVGAVDEPQFQDDLFHLRAAKSLRWRGRIPRPLEEEEDVEGEERSARARESSDTERRERRQGKGTGEEKRTKRKEHEDDRCREREREKERKK